MRPTHHPVDNLDSLPDTRGLKPSITHIFHQLLHCYVAVGEVIEFDACDRYCILRNRLRRLENCVSRGRGHCPVDGAIRLHCEHYAIYAENARKFEEQFLTF